MRSLPAQSSSRLLLPMGALALMTGAACGLLFVLAIWLMSVLEGTADPSITADTGGLWIEFGIFGIYAMLFGTAIGLLPGVGAYVAVTIQDLKYPDASGHRQARVAAYGAGIGSLLPALGLLALYLSDPIDSSLLYLAVGLVLTCFALTYVLMYFLLSCLQRRDHRSVKNSLAAQIS